MQRRCWWLDIRPDAANPYLALLKPLMERLQKSKRVLAFRVFVWDSWLNLQNGMRRS